MIPSGTTGPYPPGTYVGEIIGQRFVNSSVKGTLGFSLQFRVLNRYGPNGEMDPCRPHVGTYTQYLGSDTCAQILKETLQAMGVQVSSFTQLDPGTAGHVTLQGRRIDVECTLETYKSRQRERWRILRTPRALPFSAIQELDAKYGHVLRDGTSAS